MSDDREESNDDQSSDSGVFTDASEGLRYNKYGGIVGVSGGGRPSNIFGKRSKTSVVVLQTKECD